MEVGGEDDLTEEHKVYNKIKRHLQFKVIDKEDSDLIKVIAKGKKRSFDHAVHKLKYRFKMMETLKEIYNYYSTVDPDANT